uniref:Uncharacterized protein n=1 Tax=Glossina palpalis gambiensis TaxID=67801 RepID=A0A1B0BUU6_9MUSC
MDKGAVGLQLLLLPLSEQRELCKPASLHRTDVNDFLYEGIPDVKVSLSLSLALVAVIAALVVVTIEWQKKK